MSVVAFRPNSPHARDVASMVHPQTNLRLHETTGPAIMSRGDGVHVVDDEGRRFFDSTAGLWCASLGFNVERLATAAYEQMRTLGYYHTYRHSSNTSSIDLAERLLAIAQQGEGELEHHRLVRFDQPAARLLVPFDAPVDERGVGRRERRPFDSRCRSQELHQRPRSRPSPSRQGSRTTVPCARRPPTSRSRPPASLCTLGHRRRPKVPSRFLLRSAPVAR